MRRRTARTSRRYCASRSASAPGCSTTSPSGPRRGQAFAEVENAFCRLVDDANGTELARYTLSGGGAHTAQITAKFDRNGGFWQVRAIGEPAAGRTFEDLLPAISAHL